MAARKTKKKTTKKKKTTTRRRSRAQLAARSGIGRRLETIRCERSQRQFANDLGVFQQNVNRYENGTTPHVDFLVTLATREGVSLDWLVLGVGSWKLKAK